MSPSKAAQTYTNNSMTGDNAPEYSKDDIFEASCIYARQLLDKDAKKNYPEVEEDSEVSLIPKLNKNDLVLGKVLGRGTFGVVQEVVGVMDGNAKHSTKHKRNKKKLVPTKEEAENDIVISKESLSTHCFRDNGSARYAIKYLSDEVIGNYNLCYRAILDMTLDCKFLSTLDHPCILKLRALSVCGPFAQENFILMDRLEETLDKKILSWKKKSLRIPISRKGRTLKKYENSLNVAHDLISAVSHLHSLKIIHRDLKPENIGFGFDSDLKLFDFGLAKDVSNYQHDRDGLYCLTGYTGSCRYMAPEIAKNNPYNHSVDVYSFSILFWQLFSLVKPYEHYSYKMHQRYVVNEGHRPKIDDAWPEVIGSLMKRCWSEDIKSRPSAANAFGIIRNYLIELNNGDVTAVGCGSHHSRCSQNSGDSGKASKSKKAS